MTRSRRAVRTRPTTGAERGRRLRERGPALRALRPRRVLDLLRRVGELLETVVEPEIAGWSVLVAFTAGEGLGFNRAFLLLAEGKMLRGWFGVGPRNREEARQVWSEIHSTGALPLGRLTEPDRSVIEAEQRRHASTLASLSHALSTECGVWRRAFIARGSHPSPCVHHWTAVLDSRELMVVPLMASGQPWGVVLADNFVTHSPILRSTLEAAETLAHYLRSALERTQLLQEYQRERRRRLAAEHATALLETARTLAHDLKNPLAIAGGIARELLAAPPPDAETLARRLGIVAAGVSRAEQRVGELVDGLANRADGIALEPVDVGAVAGRVVEAFRPLAISRNVRLLCYHPSRPVLAAATKTAIERCLENLLTNGLQALVGACGEIHVAVREEPPWIRLEVADNGQALPGALRADPFAGGVTTRRGGSGLGLASVRTLAEAMGGRVEYDEREPGWVRFTVVVRRWS